MCAARLAICRIRQLAMWSFALCLYVRCGSSNQIEKQTKKTTTKLKSNNNMKLCCRDFIKRGLFSYFYCCLFYSEKIVIRNNDIMEFGENIFIGDPIYALLMVENKSAIKTDFNIYAREYQPSRTPPSAKGKQIALRIQQAELLCINK